MSIPDLCNFSINLNNIDIGATQITIPTAEGISSALASFAASVNTGFSDVKFVINSIKGDLTNIHDKVDVMHNGLSRVISAFSIFGLGGPLPSLSTQDCSSSSGTKSKKK